MKQFLKEIMFQIRMCQAGNWRLERIDLYVIQNQNCCKINIILLLPIMYYDVIIKIIMKKTTLATLILILSCASLPEKIMNGTVEKPPYIAAERSWNLHNSLFIIDLHADPLLWNRSLLEHNNYSNVDLQLLQKGNVGIQVFGIVTKVPFTLTSKNVTDKNDVIGTLAKIQHWPKETYKSLLQRALYQCFKLKLDIQKSNNQLKGIYTLDDLQNIINRRNNGGKVIGCILALEGAHALEGDLENLDLLYASGIRIFGISHLFDNEMSGSAQGKEKYGLTDLGKKAIIKAQKLNMLIDVSHASPKAIDDILSITNGPIISSHGGVQGTFDSERNLSDKHIKAIANSGGVIGIGLFKQAVGGKSVKDTAAAMRYTADLVGYEHVALGSDFDGAVVTSVNAGGLVQLTEELLNSGFTENEVFAIMGGNMKRALLEILYE